MSPKNYVYSAQGGKCDLTYSGTGPHSEPEVQHLTQFLLDTPSITAYVAIHSHGNVRVTK